MRKKKGIIGIAIMIAVAVIAATAVIGKNIYAKNLQKNVDIYISSVSLVENPDDPNNENVYGLMERFFNQTVGDICVYYDILDTDKEFTEAEKSMKFDLNTFNVYKIKIACEQMNSAENKKVFGMLTDFCQESKYMYVPCNVSSNICGENTLYYFVSKEYSEEDVKQYLKNTGSSIYVCIGKDELRPIVNYNKTIFYEPEKNDFVFEVSKNSVDVKKDEAITIECSLKNISNENYYIEHGMEAITYTYNELSENIETIAVLEQFKSDSAINRTLNITADKAGKITITASIDVKPSEFSDQYKTYTFEKDVVVNIID